MPILPISAIIMAGGKGTRLLPLTERTPKPLLKINGKTIIEGIIELLLKHQITDITISVCYLSESIIDFVASIPAYSSIKILHEETPLGDIGVLGITEKNLFEHPNLLIFNADLCTNINLSEFYNSFVFSKAVMSIATFTYKSELPYGLISSENNEVVRIDEKPILAMEANGGIYLLKKELLSLIPAHQPYKAWQLISQILEKKHKICSFIIEDIWIDIGTLESYEYAKSVAQELIEA
jgi:NDP-sugar pyrophosphorylase family protein